MTPPILELRVAVTGKDYEALVAFYQDALGLEPSALWTNEHGQAMMFEMGRGSLELFDEGHAASIDQIEAGQRLSGHIRFAFQVPDLDAAIARLTAKGVTLIHAPVVTPWGDRNARLQSPDGLQVTLFQSMKEE